jgi:integrase
MPRKLTQLMVEKVRPHPDKRLEIPDAGRPGMYLFVQPSGHKSYVVKYRLFRAQKKFVIGFPSLAAARTAATSALDLIAEGKDPVIEARRAGGDLFSSVAEEFIQRHVRPTTRVQTGTSATERWLRNEVIPVWGMRSIQSITKRDVIELVDGISDRGTPIAANRILTAIKTLFVWAVGRDIIAASPAMMVKKPSLERARERILTDEEIAALWRACDEVGYPAGDFAKVLLLTGQRRSEVAGMTWAELDLEHRVWNLPASRTKNARAHTVPLSPQAIDVLRARPMVGPGGFVFGTGSGPLTAFSRAKDAIDAAITPEPGIGWRLHDLRRTAATGMHEIGVASHIVEAVLNHQSGHRGGVAGVYNHAGYANEKRAALGAWAETVQAIVEGKGRPSVKRRLVTLRTFSAGLGNDG